MLELIFSRELYLWASFVLWLRVGLFRILHFLCQMSHSGTTFCVKLLAWGFSDYVAQLSSVLQSCPTLWPHGLQHSRLPCPSPAPGVCLNSCPLHRWCHPTISSSDVIPFSSRLQSFPASGSFPVSQFFTSGGQRIGVSASASVLPMNIKDWFPLGLTDWIPLQFKGLSKASSPTSQFKSINSSALSFPYTPTLTSIHDYWKNHSFH